MDQSSAFTSTPRQKATKVSIDIVFRGSDSVVILARTIYAWLKNKKIIYMHTQCSMPNRNLYIWSNNRFQCSKLKGFASSISSPHNPPSYQTKIHASTTIYILAVQIKYIHLLFWKVWVLNSHLPLQFFCMPTEYTILIHWIFFTLYSATIPSFFYETFLFKFLWSQYWQIVVK